MSVKTPVNAAHTNFVESIHNSYADVYGSNDRPQSQAAVADLKAISFPTSKTEFWKYTRLVKLLKNRYRFVDSGQAEPQIEAIPDLETVQLTFVNGIYQQDKSEALPEGVALSVFNNEDEFPDKFNALAQPKKHVFEALNTAYCPQTIVLKVDANISIKPVLRIAHWAEGEDCLIQPRLIIQVENGSKMSVIQSFDGDDNSGFTNALSEFFVGENAVLQIYKLESERALRHHHSSDYARVQGGGRFEILTTPLESAWTRNNLHIKLAGEQAFAKLNGLYYLRDNQHVDNNTFVDHSVPHCDSSELYKSVLDDKSTGVFNGKVIVRPDAQKTNAFQQNSNILLSQDAQNFSKPELEIYADDVKCSHGSTTGQMDEEAIFYLQSRAISKKDAERMLVTAFAGEVLDQVEHEGMKQYLYQKFSH